MSDKVKYSNEQISDLLDGIFDGSITEYEIPEDFYFAIVEYLRAGLYKGFGGTLEDFGGSELKVLTELRENVYMFSAAKSFQTLSSIRDCLLDENGDLRSQSDFLQIANQTFSDFVDDYGLTERNTAISQAINASKWQQIEKDKDILPNLVYSTVGDACDICAPLDGMTAPVEDSIWDTIAVPNHWNCLCVLEQADEEEKLTPDDEKESIFDGVVEKMDDNFKMNSGKDGYIFSPEHPYFEVSPKDKEFKDNNFGLPIPKTDK